MQGALLALLAGFFSSGFTLPIAGLVYPFRLISWLPVMYGVQMYGVHSMQVVMLRGVQPATSTLLGLAATIVVMKRSRSSACAGD